MEDVLDIGEVSRRTGLTLRALRFYEARGLVRPLRTEGGRRIYGRGELARLTAAVALKRAGFSLAQIATMLGKGRVDLGRLVAAQLAVVAVRQAEVAESKRLLQNVQSRIDRGEPIDVATLCSMIEKGGKLMQQEEWKGVVDQYFTVDEQTRFAETMSQVPADFDQQAYGAQWRDLGQRIEAALPLSPASAEAQAFVDEWFALLKPFSQVATPEMWQGTSRMYEDRENWPQQPDPGFGKQVWNFIQEATRDRLAKGGTIDGPAWMTGGSHPIPG